nr:hypothetical protein [Sphaerotilus sp. FB-3]
MVVRQPDRPRSLHPLQRLPGRLPRGRDRLQLPDRPVALRRPPRLRARLRRGGGDRLRARAAAHRRALRPDPRPARHARLQPAPAAAGLLPCAAGQPAGRRAGRGGAEAARAGG